MCAYYLYHNQDVSDTAHRWNILLQFNVINQYRYLNLRLFIFIRYRRINYIYSLSIHYTPHVHLLISYQIYHSECWRKKYSYTTTWEVIQRWGRAFKCRPCGSAVKMNRRLFNRFFIFILMISSTFQQPHLDYSRPQLDTITRCRTVNSDLYRKG
jgi:hypothetical protein